MTIECAFCDIAHHRIDASIVFEDELTMAFVDLRHYTPATRLLFLVRILMISAIWTLPPGLP